MAKKDTKNKSVFPGFAFIFVSIFVFIISTVGSALVFPDTYFSIAGHSVGSILLSAFICGILFVMGLVFSIIAIVAKLKAASFPEESAAAPQQSNKSIESSPDTSVAV